MIDKLEEIARRYNNTRAFSIISDILPPLLLIKSSMTITFEDFKKVEIRAGKILTAEKIPDTDKLLRLSVDFAEHDEAGQPTPRQIVSGIAAYFPDPATLIGRTCMFVTNLEPRTIRGHQSNGMLFAVSDDAGNFSILEPNASIAPGTLAK